MYPAAVGIDQEVEVDTIMVERGPLLLEPHPEGTRTEIANGAEANPRDKLPKSKDPDHVAAAAIPATKRKADMHLDLLRLHHHV